jgi:hypothetical protein
MLRWVATALPADRLVLVVADRGLWSPRLWHASRQHGWHPVMRVPAAATFTPRANAGNGCWIWVADRVAAGLAPARPARRPRSDWMAQWQRYGTPTRTRRG